jgi:ribosomal protein S18 acetylase RimI-like enzyme
MLRFVWSRAMDIQIRHATADDEAAVVRLWRDAGLVVSYNDPSHDFRFALSGASSDVLVGIEDTSIVGTVMVGHDGHRGWLYYVASDPARRGHGIGQRMIAAAEAWLKDRGIRKVQLMVREHNTGVVNFYEHLGYDVTPRVVMAKWIDGA